MGAGLREETGSHFFAMSNPPDEFIRPGSLSIKRLKVKEGPTPVWIVWRPGVAQGVGGDDAEAFSKILKLCRWPASTPTGQALRSLNPWKSYEVKTETTDGAARTELQSAAKAPALRPRGSGTGRGEPKSRC